MDTIKPGVAHCGSCRFYSPVGRRGGDCSQLGVLVKSNWKACCLVQDPFSQEAIQTSDLISTKELSVLLSQPNLAQEIEAEVVRSEVAKSTLTELTKSTGIKTEG